MVRQLGLWQALRVGMRLNRLTRQGEPFAHLPTPDCEEERLSREQCGPAIVLYKTLIPLLGQDRALQVTEAGATAGAVAFLKQTIGPLRRAELAAMSEEQREAFIKERGAMFFNATIVWDRVTPEEVRFTVQRCRFPRLCQAAGAEELAPVFCKGDAVFFAQADPPIILERAHTIAEGGDTCPFILKLSADL